MTLPNENEGMGGMEDLDKPYAEPTRDETRTNSSSNRSDEQRGDDRHNDEHSNDRRDRMSERDRRRAERERQLDEDELEDEEDRRWDRERDRDRRGRDRDRDHYRDDYDNDRRREKKFVDLGALFGDGIALNNRGDSCLNKILSSIKKIKDEIDDNVGRGMESLKNFGYASVTVNEGPFGYSSIVMYYVEPIADKKEANVYVFTMMIVATGRNTQQNNAQYTYNNHKYQPVSVPADSWNREYEGRVREIVTRAIRSHDKLRFHNAGCFVVGETVDPDNVEDIRTIISYGRVNISIVAREVNHGQMFAFDLLPSNVQLSMHIDMSGEPLMNIPGVEKKTGILIDVMATQERGKQDPFHEPITTVGMNLEVYWSTEDDDRDRDRHRNFLPVLNINTLEPARSSKVYDLGAHMLGVLAAAKMTNNMYWEDYLINVRGMRKYSLPGGHKKEVDLEDCTALSYLTSKTRFEPKDDNEMADFINRVFKRNIAIGMIADYRGPMSSIHRRLVNIALNRNNEHDDFIELLNKQVGGRLDDYYNPEDHDRFIIGGNSPILLGTLRDDHGNHIDLASLGVLAFYNLYGATDLDIAKDYQETFDNPDFDPNYKIYLRSQMLKDRFGGAVKITGIGEQLIFNLTGVDAYAKAVDACGFNLTPENRNGYTRRERPSGRNQFDRWSSHDVGRDLFNSRRRGGRDRDRRTPHY